METRERVCRKVYTVSVLLCAIHACMGTTFTQCVYTSIYRWILARYDVDILDYDTKQAVVNSASLNEGVDIEFDYSRKEVEVCCDCTVHQLVVYSMTV